MQCRALITINNHRVDSDLDSSPDDGSFGEFVSGFDIEFLRAGANEFKISSGTYGGDIDDFEFVNVQLRLSP